MLDVGDRIGRGDAGGDNGTAPELEPVKKGSGAAETSSSSVNAEDVGEPRDETLERVGLDIRAPAGPILRCTESWNGNLHTCTGQND
jgi:hypothetical protein